MNKYVTDIFPNFYDLKFHNLSYYNILDFWRFYGVHIPRCLLIEINVDLFYYHLYIDLIKEHRDLHLKIYNSFKNNNLEIGQFKGTLENFIKAYEYESF